MALDHAQREKRAAAALAKQAAGKKLSREETRDCEWLSAIRRREAVRETLRALPKGWYCELAGRQQKVVDETARRYGLPLTGDKVDLYAAVRALHDLVAENSSVLTAEGGANWAQEKLVQQTETLRVKRRLAEVELQLRQSELIEVADLRQRTAWLSDRLRKFATQLGRRHGREAQQMANDFFAGLAEELDRDADAATAES